ncbi:SIS domain-containing protein [Streptomyces sp. NPDC088387]|uniref:SIS domain-containing protein n=1 Tax=Streptomyces sp. NPDC088387 TaxID=3365859 RepID=UPI00382A5A12
MSGSRITFRQGQDAQPAALQRIAARVGSVLADSDLTALHRARRPLFTGIGASYAALALPVEVLRRNGMDTHRVLADEIARIPHGFDTDMLIGVSQGGRSAETLAAFEQVGSGVPTVAVLNVVPSPLYELADLCVGLGNEPDSFASTIGFTGTIVALDLLAGAFTGREHRPDPWHDIAGRLTAVREQASTVLGPLLARAAECVAVDAIASGTSRTSAEASALLLREVARLPAAAFATRNHLHGEMESAGGTLHVLYGDGRETQLARTLADAGHLSLLLTTQDVPAGPNLAVIRLPELDCGPRSVLEVAVAQELAAGLAEERGLVIESFVFANNDTKQGGLDPADFEVPASAAEGAV